MAQTLLFPDPRPIVERLGTTFFRDLPQQPGVYLLRDRTGVVVYVGKAKNLRKRLASYRVANPERLRTRHLRLLHSVEQIEVQTCESESAALAKEASLLRNLRPRFNRAGTWPGTSKWVGFRCSELGLEIAVSEQVLSGWECYGPFGYNAYFLRAAVARLLWRVLKPDSPAVPCGWSGVPLRPVLCLNWTPSSSRHMELTLRYLTALFQGDVPSFTSWILERTAGLDHPFDLVTRDLDLEDVAKLVAKLRKPVNNE